MKKKLTVMLMVLVMVVSLFTPALAANVGGYESGHVLLQSDLAAISSQLEGVEEDAVAMAESGDAEVTQQEVAAFLLKWAGMKESQLGTYPDDYNAMAESVGMTKGVEYAPEAACTIEQFNTMLANTQALYDAMHAEVRQQMFVDGLAQPIFEYSDPTQANGDTGAVRYCVYVETNYDTDGDGKLDLVKALVQLPRETLNGLKVPTIYEARPYITGCTDRGLEYNEEPFTGDLHATADKRTPAGEATTAEMVEKANPDDWYYWNSYEDMYDYEDLTWYDYYLVRGFAVVECGGLGTRGSEGYETCGSDVEIDAFKCVIEWLTGDRVAYTDKTSNVTVEADWSTGKVGMTGRSYAGTTQFGLATTGVKGLETIVPVAGIASWYEYTNSQGVATSGVAYTNTLAAYCAGRYLDPDDYATIAERYGSYLNQMKQEQLDLNGDYGPHWENRDYTKDWANIQCPALIVHGLNDTNVRTKEFDLMYQAYEKAGVPVKILLHQGTHLTPTYPAGGYEMYTNGELYDTVLNRWFSHYLFGVNNGAENMAAVTVQSNLDGSWTTYDDWKTDASVTYAGSAEESATSTVAGRTANAAAQKAVYTFEVPEDVTVQGAVAVTFTAKPTSEKIGELDGIRLTADLKDNSAEAYMAFVPSRSYLPLTTLKESGAWIGGGVSNFDLVEYKQTATTSKSIGQGYIDVYNPGAGYQSCETGKRVDLQNGESYTYTVYLQPSVYTVKAGHTLELSLSMSSGDISLEVDNASVSVKVPVHEDVQPTPDPDPDPIDFVDVKDNDWFKEAVDFVSANGLMDGMGNNKFQPGTGTSRAMVATVLYRLAGEPSVEGMTCPFTDVGGWYHDAIVWAYNEGVVKGMTATTFCPNQLITREQMATMLWRMIDVDGEFEDEFSEADIAAALNEMFKDGSTVSGYAKYGVAFCAGAELMVGDHGTFRPQATLNRAELAQVLMNLCTVADDAAETAAAAFAA